jgi:3D (Asp-Asp-Asp) domain-containing protein
MRNLRPALSLLAVLLASTSALAAETTRTVVNTAYADTDNDPPNSDAIAFPKSGGNPTIHNGTGGTGTYADPITIATDTRDFPAGTRIYVPSMLFYGMVEDSCAQCIADRNAARPTKIDFYAGGKGQSLATMEAYESTITTNTRQIIVNPDPGKNIIVGPLWDTRRKTSGNGTGTPDTSASPPPPPPPPPATSSVPTLKIPPVYGWGGISGGGYSRNDAVLSFKDGAIRVSGVAFPAAQIAQDVVQGQQYTVKATVAAVDPPNSGIGWLKVTNADSTVVYFEKTYFTGTQTFTVTANSPSITVWAGTPSEATSYTVDVKDLSFTPVAVQP